MQLELFEELPKPRRSTDLEELAEACWAGCQEGMSITEIAARMGIRRTEAAGLALMFRDDDLCAVLRECDSVSTFFDFLAVPAKVRQTVLKMAVSKITKRLIREATQKQERKPVIRRLGLAVLVSKPVPVSGVCHEDEMGDESGFLPEFLNLGRCRQGFVEFVT